MKYAVLLIFGCLTACSGADRLFFYKPDCSDQPYLKQDCRTKEGCGVDTPDNVNYRSCKLRCDSRVEKQCRAKKPG